MQNPSYNAMVKAMRTNDARHDGKFYVGVKTMRIYCLPSCKAKQPRLENVVFFFNKKEAMAAGFRGCQRCRSEFYPNVEPEWWSGVLSYMQTAIQSKSTERDIAVVAGVDISTIRRYFKAFLKTTPMAFHRKMRLAYARSQLEQGADYLSAAFECGFESASGFREAFIKQYGCSPGKIHGL